MLDQNAFDPVVSADGTLVAYRAGPLGTYVENSWVIRADGSLPPVRVAEGAAPIGLSPDGRILVAQQINPRTGKAGRTFAQLVSGGPQVILSRRASEALDIDDDTATLLVFGRTPTSPGRVVEVPLAGGTARTLATGVGNGAARSRTGRIAYGTGLTRSPVTGFRVTLPRSRAGKMVPARAAISDPQRPFAWTRDSRRLLIGQTKEDDFTAVAVILIDVASGRRRTLARRVNGVGGLSPDGRAVLVERHEDGAPRVLALPLDGSRPRVLARPARNARWSGR